MSVSYGSQASSVESSTTFNELFFDVGTKFSFVEPSSFLDKSLVFNDLRKFIEEESKYEQLKEENELLKDKNYKLTYELVLKELKIKAMQYNYNMWEEFKNTFLA